MDVRGPLMEGQRGGPGSWEQVNLALNRVRQSSAEFSS